MEKFEVNGLIIQHEKNGNTITIKWTGKSREMDPAEKIMPIMNSLLETAEGNLILDFCDLEYINSSSVVPVITFVKAADEKKIDVVIQYNPKMSWQKAMFKAFDALTKILKHLKVKEII